MAAKVSLETRRQQLFEETQQKPRAFGLFSASPPLSIADNSYSVPKMKKLNDEGTVAIGPKNFLGSPGKKGGGESGLFSKPIYISESFRAEIPRGRPDRRNAKKTTGHANSVHEFAFKSGGTVRRKLSPFEHLTPYNIRKINRRDADGAVITQPANLSTSPPKKGRSMTPGIGFSEPRTFSPEPYEREYRQRMAEAKSKALLRPEEPFCAMAKTGKTFNKDYDVFYDAEIKAPIRPKPTEYAHPDPEAPSFKTTSPAKTHRADTFEKFPKYMENPLKFTTRRAPSESDIPKWKPTSNGRSAPIKSIMNARSNLRTEVRQAISTVKV